MFLLSKLSLRRKMTHFRLNRALEGEVQVGYTSSKLGYIRENINLEGNGVDKLECEYKL